MSASLRTPHYQLGIYASEDTFDPLNTGNANMNKIDTELYTISAAEQETSDGLATAKASISKLEEADKTLNDKVDTQKTDLETQIGNLDNRLETEEHKSLDFNQRITDNKARLDLIDEGDTATPNIYAALAPSFSSEVKYLKNAIVFYENKLYSLKQDAESFGPAEWDGSKWNETNIGNILQSYLSSENETGIVTGVITKDYTWSGAKTITIDFTVTYKRPLKSDQIPSFSVTATGTIYQPTAVPSENLVLNSFSVVSHDDNGFSGRFNATNPSGSAYSGTTTFTISYQVEDKNV